MTLEEKMLKLAKELKKSAIASRNDSVYEALMLTSAIIQSIDWKEEVNE